MKNKIWISFKNNSYYYFLGIASSYAIFYSIYSLNSNFNAYLKDFDDIISYFSSISILFFTAGIFAVSLKYLQFLGVFEKEFNRAISSDAFDKKLEKQLKQITFSEEFLIEQSNLGEIWRTVTLCKYKQQFPDLYDKLKKKIKNELFITNNISYYYKNFQLKYDIELIDDDHVKITESASLTIVRPNTEKFQWEFGLYYEELEDKIFNPTLFFEVNNVEDIKFDKDDIKIIKEPFFHKKYISREFSGVLEYHLDRKIESFQNLKSDRAFAFASDRIIDDISLKIESCDKLNVFFTTVNDNKLYKNGALPNDDLAFINRDLFLPGEKFKMFFYKK